MPEAPITNSRPARIRQASPTSANNQARRERSEGGVCAGASRRCAIACRTIRISQSTNSDSNSAPSARDNTPSSAMIKVRTGTARARTKSRLSSAKRAVSAPNNSAKPRIKPIFTTLLPSASPRPISGLPASAARVDTVNSGLEVAKAARVVATSSLGRRNPAATPSTPLRKASPPNAANGMAASSTRKSVVARGRVMTCPPYGRRDVPPAIPAILPESESPGRRRQAHRYPEESRDEGDAPHSGKHQSWPFSP